MGVTGYKRMGKKLQALRVMIYIYIYKVIRKYEWEEVERLYSGFSTIVLLLRIYYRGPLNSTELRKMYWIVY